MNVLTYGIFVICHRNKLLIMVSSCLGNKKQDTLLLKQMLF